MQREHLRQIVHAAKEHARVCRVGQALRDLLVLKVPELCALRGEDRHLRPPRFAGIEQVLRARDHSHRRRQRLEDGGVLRIAVAGKIVFRAEGEKLDRLDAVADEAQDLLRHAHRRLPRDTRNDQRPEANASQLCRRAQPCGIERPVAGVGVAEPVLGRDARRAALAAELEPVVLAHGGVGIVFVPVVPDRPGLVKRTEEVVEVHNDRHARTDRLLVRLGNLREEPRRRPRHEAVGPVEQPTRRQAGVLLPADQFDLVPRRVAKVRRGQPAIPEISVERRESSGVVVELPVSRRVVPSRLVAGEPEGDLLLPPPRRQRGGDLFLDELDELLVPVGGEVERVTRRVVDRAPHAREPEPLRCAGQRRRDVVDRVESHPRQPPDSFAPADEVLVAADEPLADNDLLRPLFRGDPGLFHRRPIYAPVVAGKRVHVRDPSASGRRIFPQDEAELRSVELGLGLTRLAASLNRALDLEFYARKNLLRRPLGPYGANCNRRAANGKGQRQPLAPIGSLEPNRMRAVLRPEQERLVDLCRLSVHRNDLDPRPGRRRGIRAPRVENRQRGGSNQTSPCKVTGQH